MSESIGQIVLEIKADTSLDGLAALGHNVRMANSAKILTDYQLGFLARTAAAREKDPERTQAKMARHLRLPQDSYKWYEIRTLLPHEYIETFLAVTGVSFEWMFSGEGKGPNWQDRYDSLKAKQDAHLANAAPKRQKKRA